MDVLSLLAISIAPGLAIILFILYRDKLDREPRSILFVSFCWGMLSTIPAVALELTAGYFNLDATIHGTIIFAFFGVAMVEELVKFIPLRYYAFTRRSFDEPLDGIVHGVMIAMGFATLENIGYVLDPDNGGMNVGIARMFLSVPGHAAYGIIMGYYLGKAKFNYAGRARLLLTGILLATFFHGLYDGCLFVAEKTPDDVTKGMLLLGALTTDIFAYVLAARLIKQHRRISKNLYQHDAVFTWRNATKEDIPLIQTITKQVWPQTYEKILKRKQIAYMMKLMYGRDALSAQIDAGQQFFIIYNNAIPVGFAAFSEIQPTVYKLHKIYILLNQQGRGTGKFAIDQVIAAVKPAGATVLQLNVNRFNKAKGFYEKIGFAVLKEEKIDIGGGYVMDDYVLEKKLDLETEALPT